MINEKRYFAELMPKSTKMEVNYKKKYEDLIERLAKAKEDNDVCDERYCCVIDGIVPELKESEGDIIIKALKSGFKLIEREYNLKGLGGIKFEKILAWAEKQGETFTKKDVDDAYLKGVCDTKQELEKQGEQKPAVIIPKFRVGDVIRIKGSNAGYTITDISDGCYRGNGWGLDIIAGDESNDYELVEQKPAEWSEEDESHIGNLCHFLKEYGNRYYGALALEGTISWLKSIKDRVQPQSQWKPSEEQMKALEDAEDRKVLCDGCQENCEYQVKESAEIQHNKETCKENGDSLTQEPVSEDLGEYINELSKQFPEVSFAKLSRIAVRVAKRQKEHLWKPANGDDLPIIDREVIALLDNGKVVFAHRPPEYWDGKNIITGKVTRHYPKTYGKGGWNIPNVKWWLDCSMPNVEED